MRRVALVLLVAMVLLAVSACGGSGSPSQPTATPAPTNTPARKAPSGPPTKAPAPGGPLSGKKVLANGVWECPVNTAGANYVGDKNTEEFHRLDCSTAEKIPPENRVCFVDDQVALKFGYALAKDCSP